MTARIPLAVLFVSLCAALPALPAAAQPFSDLDVIPRTPFPGDRVHVPMQGGGECNAATIDPQRTPQLRPISHEVSANGPQEDLYRYELRYWLRPPVNPICGTPPPPLPIYADVGALPLGIHTFEVVGFLGEAPHADYVLYPTAVRVHPGLPLDVAGLWFDPEQGGRGLSVMPISATELNLLWFTHDGTGDPVWVASLAKAADIAANEASGSAFTTRGTPLAPGPATLVPEDWGTLRFSYEGCGRARLSWDAIDAAIVDGSQALNKLAQSRDDPSCAPKGAVNVVWVRD